MCGAEYVTEAPGLHTTNVRDIHSIQVTGSMIRIFTVDIIAHPGGGRERRVNNDIMISLEDLTHCISKVLAATKGPMVIPLREMMSQLGVKGH